MEQRTILFKAKTEISTDSLEGFKRLASAATDVRAAIERTKKEVSDLKKQLKNPDLGEDDFKKVTAQIVRSELALSQLTAEQKNLTKEFKGISEPIGEYKKLSNELNTLRTRVKNVRAEGGVVDEKDLQRVGELDTLLKDIDAEVGQYGRNVGNYSSALEGLADSIGTAFGGQAQAAVEGFDTALQLVTKNPIVAAISLIVAGLGAVFQAFKQTERGAKLMEQISSILSVTWIEFAGVVDDAVTSLLSFTKDPISGLKNLGQSILDNIVNRFTAVFDIIGNTGQAIKALVTGDFDALGSLAKDTAQSFIQLGSGLDKAQQNNLADSFGELTDQMEQNITTGTKIFNQRRALRRENIELQKSVEALTTQEEILNQIAGDSTLSFQKQIEANEEARKVSEQRARAEVQLAENNLRLLNEQIKVRQANNVDTLALEEEQLSALQAIEAAERSLTLTLAQNATERRQINQDVRERDLDFLLDFADNTKSINERIIKDDTIAAAERQKLLEETAQLSLKSFDKQIEVIQSFTNAAINSNELLGESDATELATRIRALGLSEIIEGRLLEVLRDRRTAILDLKEAGDELLAAEQARRANDPVNQPIDFLPTAGNNFNDDPDIIADDKFTANAIKNAGLRADAVDTETEKQDKRTKAIDDTISSAAGAARAIANIFDEESRAREAALKIEEKVTAVQTLLSQKRIIQSQIETIQNNIEAVSQGAKVPFPGNLLAIGAIIAAIATGVVAARRLATFHDGGIVGAGGYKSDSKLRPGEQMIKAQKGEAVINVDSLADNRIRTFRGTNKQVASKINELGGGVGFASGASLAAVPVSLRNFQTPQLNIPQPRFLRDSGGGIDKETANTLVQLLRENNKIGNRIADKKPTVNVDDLNLAARRKERDRNISIA